MVSRNVPPSPSLNVNLICSFYFQASNAQDGMQTTQPSIRPDFLSLKSVEDKTKVPNPSPLQHSFKQPLRYCDRPLVFETGLLSSADVQLMKNPYGEFAVIPMSAFLREQLNIIEEFVTVHMDIPTILSIGWKARNDQDSIYKKLWEGDRLAIPLSHWCGYFKQVGNQTIPIQRTDLAEGLWNVTFSVSGLYYGYHKDNKLVSLSLHTKSILYKPNQTNVDVILEQILNECGGNPTASAAVEKHVTNKRKRKKESNQSISNTAL